MDEISFYTIPTLKLTEQLGLFKNLYDLYQAVICPDQEPELLPTNIRKCRFCSKSEPQVKFQHKAHIIPHQLGNDNFISDFECDTCNKKYGLFENDLSNFLGINKTLFQTKGKKGVPNLNSPQNSLTAKRVSLLNETSGISIEKKDLKDNSIIIDHKNGTATIEYQKNPYRPFNVYKILLKISLSCLSEEDIENYSWVLDILNNKNKIELLKPLANIFRTTLSYERSVTRPYVILLKKKELFLDVPTHCVLFFYSNVIFQYFIPLCKQDVQFYRFGERINYNYCPPLSTREFSENDSCKIERLDLSSAELKKDDVEVWKMTTDQSIETFGAIDPDTATFSTVDAKDFNEKDIRKIILVPSGFVITPDKLKKNNNQIIDDELY